ncbi:MAG: BNR-4 repeat-containing protein [Armatimonadota bacterium]
MGNLINPSEPFLLSNAGSTRATAYEVANKAVRIGGHTHVTWLDAVARVCVRTYDHAVDRWQDTVYIDEGIDNHTNPCLSVTPEGTLRLAYGPHGFWEENIWNVARFKLLESERPDDVTEWRQIGSTGYGATYACLVTDQLGRDHLVYRGGTYPQGCIYERRQPNNVWDRLTKLSGQADFAGYTFVNGSLVVAPGEVLYCGFMYYSDDRSHGACILKSPDGGSTWEGVDGRPVQLPLHFDPAYALPQGGENPYLHGLACDHEGNPVALTGNLIAGGEEYFLSIFRDGGWQSTLLNTFLPEGWSLTGGTVTVDAQDRILIAAMAATGSPGEEIWGLPSTESFLLASADGGRTFEATQVSPTSPDIANWLPNISHVGADYDLSRPLLLYTHGNVGEGCGPEDRTEVYAVWID